MSYPNPTGMTAAFKAVLAMLRPPPPLLPSEWAEQNIEIPAANSLSGPIRFANAPYQVEPLNLLFDPTCYRVTLKAGAQVGKTTIALCAQAYAIAHAPRSQIMMQPSEGDLKVWLETKWNPLAATSRAIRRRVAKARSREGVNNTRMKSYPGGFFFFAWAGSPKTMRSRSAPFIVCDEVDGYKATEEGHPVGLLWQRAATFGDQRKLFEISTPTLAETSYIDKAFEAGDQRRYFIRCPHCDEEQVLKWENVVWDGKQESDDLNLEHLDKHEPSTARYCCPHCGGLINDGQRYAAIRKGRWIASKPFKGHASFHIWEAYSLFVKLQTIVQSYLDKLQTDDLQTFWNVSLAECWEVKGEAAEAAAIEARAEEYAAEVPDPVLYLTCGVDMQTDRLELETVGWGLNEESWSIDYRVFYGDPLAPDVWQELEDYLKSEFTKADGTVMRIKSTCVDTGGTSGYTQAAYDWLRGKTGRRIFAIKGVGGWGRPIVAQPNRKYSGKDARKVDLFLVGTDEAKLALMRRLQLVKPGAPGYCHFPLGRDSEYYEQLTAEKLVTRRVKGYSVREWHKTRERNEALDCRVYAHAALKLLNPDLRKQAAKAAAAAQAEAERDVAVEKLKAGLNAMPADAREQLQEAATAAIADTPPVATQKEPPKKRKLRRSGGVGLLNW